MGRYRTGKILGQGGFGTVFEGYDMENHQPVAIKFIPTNNVLHWVYRGGERIPQEVDMLLSAKSVSGAVKIIDYWPEQTNYVIVMERPVLCEDLLSYVQSHGTFTETEAIELFARIVNTLFQLHCIGIAHRDIKPENILLDLTGSHRIPYPLIIDFGCASRYKAGKNSRLPSFQGTVIYAPPEWLSHRQIFGQEWDVWGLGILLLYTLFGHSFGGWFEGGVDKSRISTDLYSLLERVLCTNPYERISLTQICTTLY